MATHVLDFTASDIVDQDMKCFLQNGPSGDSTYGEEFHDASELSYKVEMTVAYSSEKLANLENLLLHVLSQENDIGSIDIENDSDFSSELFERAFTFDMLYSISHLELIEVDELMCDLQDLISNTLRKISTSDNSTLLLNGLLAKLHDSEEMLRNSQERVLEMKIQLAKMQMNSTIFRQDKWNLDLIMGVKENFLSQSKEWKPEIRTLEQRRVLRMLDKSLARELELEKKLTESKQTEEDLKLKNQLLEQVSSFTEEAAQVAWTRFLEADNASAVLVGILDDMLEKFRISSFNDLRNLRANEEEEVSMKLKDCLNQLNEKESLIQKHNSTISQLTIDSSEVNSSREKVHMLEENLEQTKSRLKDSSASNEMLRQNIKEMDCEIEILRENLLASDIRAESAEQRVTQLTNSNMDLTEEIEILKDMNGNNVSSLEKQLRELDLQFQQTRASSETSLGQQNMLYSAIWDMETLIAELKQKVATADNNLEGAEERNVMLSEEKEKLEKELGLLRAKVEIMDESFEQVALERKASAKDISLTTSLITDTVMKLGLERKRIQKQVNCLIKENNSLREKLHLVKKINSFEVLHYDGMRNNKLEKSSSGLDSDHSNSEKNYDLKTNEVTSGRELLLQQVETLTTITDAITESNIQESPCSTVIMENKKLVKNGNYYPKTCMFLAVLAVVLISILTSNLRVSIELVCH